MRACRLLTIAALFATLACQSEEKFPKLGKGIASPIDVTVSSTGEHFYVLNADFDRTYNQGSILVLDEEGNKLRAIETPRMGRALVAAGDAMLALFDRQDDEEGPKVQLYYLGDDPAAPALVRQWEIGCSPVNAVAVAGYQHFAVMCDSGSLYVGTFAGSKHAESRLKRVRGYGLVRRALLIDPNRELLLAFPTVFDRQNVHDRLLTDVTGYSESGEETRVDGKRVPNEIPDEFEETRAARDNTGRRQWYQFIVYDLKAERENPPHCEINDLNDSCDSFPYRKNSNVVTKSEFRWIYFKVNNFDGTPDLKEKPADALKTKYYRTNFWEVKPDPVDPNAFYLSHRGPPGKDVTKGSPYANHVVRARIVGDLRADPETLTPPKTGDVLSFERVYGFKGESNLKYKYPGDIEVSLIGGRKVLFVNHFRDLVNWVRGDVYFSVVAQSLEGDLWLAETSNNTDPLSSWFQLAVNQRGRAVSLSFYGSKVKLLEVTPGVAITVLDTIE